MAPKGNHSCPHDLPLALVKPDSNMMGKQGCIITGTGIMCPRHGRYIPLDVGQDHEKYDIHHIEVVINPP